MAGRELFRPGTSPENTSSLAGSGSACVPARTQQLDPHHLGFHSLNDVSQQCPWLPHHLRAVCIIIKRILLLDARMPLNSKQRNNRCAHLAWQSSRTGQAQQARDLQARRAGSLAPKAAYTGMGRCLQGSLQNLCPAALPGARTPAPAARSRAAACTRMAAVPEAEVALVAPAQRRGPAQKQPLRADMTRRQCPLQPEQQLHMSGHGRPLDYKDIGSRIPW